MSILEILHGRSARLFFFVTIFSMSCSFGFWKPFYSIRLRHWNCVLNILSFVSILKKFSICLTFTYSTRYSRSEYPHLLTNIKIDSGYTSFLDYANGVEYDLFKYTISFEGLVC